MPRGLSYKEISELILLNGRELVTTENEFNLLRENTKPRPTPSQTPLVIKCECGNEFKITYDQFRSAKKYNCNECVRKKKHNEIYSTERINNIIRLYNDGFKMSDISKVIKTKIETISKILKDNNVEIRNTTDYKTCEELATNRKYTFDMDFFEKIDTQEKAYWLGFIYADGNVFIRKYNEGRSKGGTLDIALKDTDDYHLYNFVRHIHGNVPVTYREIKLNNKKFRSCRVLINSIKMCKDLVRHGCVPNKSLVLKFPTSIPQHLIRHFIRGYYDGDGCIGFYEESRTLHFSVLGTKDFLKDLKNELKVNGIKSNVIRETKSKAYCMQVSGRDNLANLYNYLYTDALVFLERKINIYREGLIFFNKRFNISKVSKMFLTKL